MRRTRLLCALALGVGFACSASGDPNPMGPGAVDPDGVPDIGPNASLNGRRPFPDDNPWNTPVDGAAVDPNSDVLIAGIGLDDNLHPDFGADFEGPFGIPYVVVDGDTPGVPVSFLYDDESDPGPYPIPADAPIEGGPNGTGDRHILVLDRDNWVL